MAIRRFLHINEILVLNKIHKTGHMQISPNSNIITVIELWITQVCILRIFQTYFRFKCRDKLTIKSEHYQTAADFFLSWKHQLVKNDQLINFCEWFDDIFLKNSSIMDHSSAVNGFFNSFDLSTFTYLFYEYFHTIFSMNAKSL